MRLLLFNVLMIALQTGDTLHNVGHWVRTVTQDRMTDEIATTYTNFGNRTADAQLMISCTGGVSTFALTTGTAMSSQQSAELMVRYDRDPASTQPIQLLRDGKTAVLRDSSLEVLRHHRMLVRVDLASGAPLDLEFELDGLDRMQFTHDCYRPTPKD